MRTAAFTVWLGLGGAADSHAQTMSARQYEYQVKVAFIYNFSRFVDWPDEAFIGDTSSLTVCVLGNNPFGGALDTIKGKNVKDKRIEIKRLTSTSKLDGCQILFIGSPERARLTQILDSAKKSGVLTISEMSQFTQAGGIVALAMRKNRIRFSVNLDVAEETGLTISSRVLRLATVVNYSHQDERK